MPRTTALNSVTSEVESVIPPMPRANFFTNNKFKNTFKTIDENATINGVAESVND